VRLAVTASALYVLVLAAPALAAPAPFGVVEQTLGRFDPDTLAPVGASIEVAEPHTGPILSPAADRFAMGLSAPPGPGARSGARVGLWIVNRSRMQVEHAVQTGIAAEAVSYPGVVAALLQNGQLVTVNPRTGAITRRHTVGYSSCAPPAVQAAGRGVFVNEIRSNGLIEMAFVDADGTLHKKTVQLGGGWTGSCRKAPLVADPARHRVYVVGPRNVAVVDVATRRATLRPIGDSSSRRSAALVPGGGLAVAGDHGLRVLDTRTWTPRWRDAAARTVIVSGRTVLASGAGVRAHAAANGRVRWRLAVAGAAAAAVAGRVYVNTRQELQILDLANGRRVGSHPAVFSDIALI
jgi:hypothetical protein